MKIVDRNTLLGLLTASKQNNYAIAELMRFANDFIFDENEEVEYTEDFIENFSNLMLYFDTLASNEREKLSEIIDSLVESLMSREKITKEDIDILLKY